MSKLFKVVTSYKDGGGVWGYSVIDCSEGHTYCEWEGGKTVIEGGREMLGLMNIYLDNRSAVGQASIPNLARRNRRLCAAQQREKSGFSCFCQQCASERVYELVEQRPGVREAPAASLGLGNVVPPFFVSKPLNSSEVSHA